MAGPPLKGRPREHIVGELVALVLRPPARPTHWAQDAEVPTESPYNGFDRVLRQARIYGQVRWAVGNLCPRRRHHVIEDRSRHLLLVRKERGHRGIEMVLRNAPGAAEAV